VAAPAIQRARLLSTKKTPKQTMLSILTQTTTVLPVKRYRVGRLRLAHSLVQTQALRPPLRRYLR
jgi:hypothetical protein